MLKILSRVLIVIALVISVMTYAFAKDHACVAAVFCGDPPVPGCTCTNGQVGSDCVDGGTQILYVTLPPPLYFAPYCTAAASCFKQEEGVDCDFQAYMNCTSVLYFTNCTTNVYD